MKYMVFFLHYFTHRKRMRKNLISFANEKAKKIRYLGLSWFLNKKNFALIFFDIPVLLLGSSNNNVASS